MPFQKKSYFHRGDDKPLIGDTIPEHFLKIVRKFPDGDAVVSVHQKRRISYGELSQEVDVLARGLLKMGYKRNDRIGIWSTNNVEWLILQMATARIGVVLVNINPAYRLRELEYSLKLSEVQGLFIIPAFRTSDYVSMLLEIIPGLEKKQDFPGGAEFPHLKHVVVYDPDKPMKTARPAQGFLIWSDIIDAAENISEDRLDDQTFSLDRDDTINIQYTSGTTGFPKAVKLSHHNILNNAWFSADAMHFTEKDRLCIPVPFYHCFGMVLSNLLCLCRGACMVMPSDHFDASAVLEAVESEKCTALHGVPTMFIAELEILDSKKFDLSTLRTGIMAGAPCPPALMRRVMEDLNCPEILIGYGETEASPLTHLTTKDDSLVIRTETVGMNLPHQEVKIIKPESGCTVPIGEIGEICFRGYHIMSGYYGQPDKTAETIDQNGWLFSGDLGTMDENGYVRITGRRKEMIIRGGENIYPKEIEAFLFTHPFIAQAAVIGVPDEFYGEQVMAWIQLHAGKKLSEEDVKNFCKDQISHFKIPRYVWFVDEFPMTVTGKIQKYKMQEIAIEKMGLKKGELSS